VHFHFSRCIPSDSDPAETETTECSVNDDKLQKSSALSLIRVFGDGRCLFRCAAIHGVHALRNTARNRVSGLALDISLQNMEQQLSDRIRSEVVESLHAEQAILEVETSNLPFMLDSNMGKSYSSLGHRLEMMTKPNEYAGYLECLTLSYVSGRQVLIYEDKKQYYHLLAKFPVASTDTVEAIRLLYQMDSTHQDGHFDLIVDEGSTSDYWNVSC